jgi:hypothetical protein
MTKTLIWITFPLIGFFLALLPKPKVVFIIMGICAVGAAAYILTTRHSDEQGIWFGVVIIGGPMAAGLVCAGALVGLWSRNLAIEGKKHYALLIVTIIVGSAVFIVFESQQQEKALIDEKRLAAEFVKKNEVIIQHVGAKSSVNLILSTMKNGTLVSYDFSVRGMKELYVVVEVFRQRGNPIFTLACMSPLDMDKDDPRKLSCRK